MKAIKKLFLVNGAPNSGKDEACEYLTGYFRHVENTLHTCFKRKLYQVAAELYCIEYNKFYRLATGRDTKELKISTIRGMLSPREILIHTSESVIKPNFDKKYFGCALYQYVHEYNSQFYENDDGTCVFVSDCGFTDEIIAVIEAGDVKPVDVVLIRLHRDGCSFVGDSRSFVSLPDGYTNIYDLENNGTLDDFHKNLKEIVWKHLDI